MYPARKMMTMRYSRERLARIFMDWPALRDSTSIDAVIERVDVVEAVARYEGVTYDEAYSILDRAWDTVRGMGELALVTGAVAFADQIVREINQ